MVAETLPANSGERRMPRMAVPDVLNQGFSTHSGSVGRRKVRQNYHGCGDNHYEDGTPCVAAAGPHQAAVDSLSPVSTNGAGAPWKVRS
jgi:hypothetical protein